jgi:bacillithiol biosynthesis cysteine-adding enzyme BshC
MVISHVKFNVVRQFAKRDRDYQSNPEIFSDFIRFLPDEAGLLKAIKERNDFPVNRSKLVSAIRFQYDKLIPSARQLENIESLLNENSFTVITAHQPALFTGPFYYISKIVSTIVLSQKLRALSGKCIVPVFINGSEDHDFEEVNHLTLYGKKVVWSNQESGPVGRKSLEGLQESLNLFTDILGQSEEALNISKIFNDSIAKANNYNDFVFFFLNELFGKYGLIVVNTDDITLKKLFIPVIQREIREMKSQSIVQETQNRLEKLGYKPQAHAREINFFYIQKGIRERIVSDGGKYLVLNTDICWREDEIKTEIENHPDRFSPNVVLRPVYQESIFPNIAYIGGGGELAYWQERKTLMEYYKVFMPVLIRRNSIMFIPGSVNKILNKLNLSWLDFFNDLHTIIQNYIKSVSSVDTALDTEKNELTKIFDQIVEKSQFIDKGLRDSIEVEKTKVIKQIELIEGKFSRSMKKNEETSVNQITNIYHKLFPGDGMQERVDNFFQYYLTFGEKLLETMFKELDPLNKDLLVISEE